MVDNSGAHRIVLLLHLFGYNQSIKRNYTYLHCEANEKLNDLQYLNKATLSCIIVIACALLEFVSQQYCATEFMYTLHFTTADS